jgi:hypothetical protein
MKPKTYYGNNPQQFAPCDVVISQLAVSIKLHPAVLAIRNKRKRMRLVKVFARSGIKTYILPAWKIYPHTPP